MKILLNSTQKEQMENFPFRVSFNASTEALEWKLSRKEEKNQLGQLVHYRNFVCKKREPEKKKIACPLCKVLNFVKNYFLLYNAKICFLSFAAKIYFLCLLNLGILCIKD